MAENEDIKQEPEVEKEPETVDNKKKKQKKEDPLRKQVEELTDKLAKEKDDYIRLMAEFETFRRRSAEERLSLVASASADTVKGMLPVLDACERAIEMLANSTDGAAKEGTNLIYDKLMGYLKTKGLDRIEAKGEKFDTDFHEAVTQIPAGSEEMKGKVIDVIQTGYTFNGKVIRYAKVVVGA
jgi:molecular chaperone GrpE